MLLLALSTAPRLRMVESECAGQGPDTCCCSTASCFEAKHTTHRVVSVQVVHPYASWELRDAYRMVVAAAVHQVMGHREMDCSLVEERYSHSSKECEDERPIAAH